ncbi:MAG: hypothetical protein U0935_20960 [Pirellulales bacterium]
MNETPANPPPTASPAHRAARGSIIAALVCLFGNGVLNQLIIHRQWRDVAWLSWSMNIFTSGLLVAGLVLGAIGLAGGLRRRSSDTIGVAIIGLLLNAGIIALALWGLSVLRQTQATSAVPRSLPHSTIHGCPKVIPSSDTCSTACEMGMNAKWA